ncbi:MAG: thioredoxin domain-containing protein [Gemmatimonadaceae bacterium]|nr:thioredoxin domain-containing protein [Gemmatimonadaceae bacterium]
MPQGSSNAGALQTYVLTGAAVLMAISVAYRTFAPVTQRQSGPPPMSARPVPEWKSLVARGLSLGDSTAPITVAVFTDLQCPFCMAFHRSLDSALKNSPSSFRVVYLPFPLSVHPHATTAALATECFARQAQVAEWFTTVYAQQEMIESKSMATFALEAGVSDTAEFSKCMSTPSVAEKVRVLVRDAERLGVKATPTLLVNQWLIDGGVQSPYDLQRVIANVAQNKRPL